MKLEGNLDIFSLRELIEMSVYSSVIGVLNLKGPQQTGHIFFRDGVAYHCAYGDLSGEAALVALFEAKNASFTFVADAVVDQTTLWGDITSVMDRCEELAARWQQVRAALPSAPVVPHLVSNPGQQSLSIETAHFAMIAGIDGVRTLDEIADVLSLEALDVYEAAARLQQDGLIELRPLGSKPVRSDSTPSGDTASSRLTGGTSSVIDRILTSLQSVALPSPHTSPSSSYSPALPSSYSPVPPSSYSPAPPSADDDPILRLLRG